MFTLEWLPGVLAGVVLGRTEFRQGTGLLPQMAIWGLPTTPKHRASARRLHSMMIIRVICAAFYVHALEAHVRAWPGQSGCAGSCCTTGELPELQNMCVARHVLWGWWATFLISLADTIREVTLILWPTLAPMSYLNNARWGHRIALLSKIASLMKPGTTQDVLQGAQLLLCGLHGIRMYVLEQHVLEFAQHFGALTVSAFLGHAWALSHQGHKTHTTHTVDWPEEALRFLALYLTMMTGYVGYLKLYHPSRLRLDKKARLRLQAANWERTDSNLSGLSHSSLGSRRPGSDHLSNDLNGRAGSVTGGGLHTRSSDNLTGLVPSPSGGFTFTRPWSRRQSVTSYTTNDGGYASSAEERRQARLREEAALESQVYHPLFVARLVIVQLLGAAIFLAFSITASKTMQANPTLVTQISAALAPVAVAVQLLATIILLNWTKFYAAHESAMTYITAYAPLLIRLSMLYCQHIAGNGTDATMRPATFVVFALAMMAKRDEWWPHAMHISGVGLVLLAAKATALHTLPELSVVNLGPWLFALGHVVMQNTSFAMVVPASILLRPVLNSYHFPDDRKVSKNTEWQRATLTTVGEDGENAAEGEVDAVKAQVPPIAIFAAKALATSRRYWLAIGGPIDSYLVDVAGSALLIFMRTHAAVDGLKELRFGVNDDVLGKLQTYAFPVFGHTAAIIYSWLMLYWSFRGTRSKFMVKNRSMLWINQLLVAAVLQQLSLHAAHTVEHHADAMEGKTLQAPAYLSHPVLSMLTATVVWSPLGLRLSTFKTIISVRLALTLMMACSFLLSTCTSQPQLLALMALRILLLMVVLYVAGHEALHALPKQANRAAAARMVAGKPPTLADSVMLAVLCTPQRAACTLLALMYVLLSSRLSNELASQLLRFDTPSLLATNDILKTLLRFSLASATQGRSSEGEVAASFIPPELVEPLTVVLLAAIAWAAMQGLDLVTASDVQREHWYTEQMDIVQALSDLRLDLADDMVETLQQHLPNLFAANKADLLMVRRRNEDNDDDDDRHGNTVEDTVSLKFAQLAQLPSYLPSTLPPAAARYLSARLRTLTDGEPLSLGTTDTDEGDAQQLELMQQSMHVSTLTIVPVVASGVVVAGIVVMSPDPDAHDVKFVNVLRTLASVLSSVMILSQALQQARAADMIVQDVMPQQVAECLKRQAAAAFRGGSVDIPLPPASNKSRHASGTGTIHSQDGLNLSSLNNLNSSNNSNRVQRMPSVYTPVYSQIAAANNSAGGASVMTNDDADLLLDALASGDGRARSTCSNAMSTSMGSRPTNNATANVNLGLVANEDGHCRDLDGASADGNNDDTPKWLPPVNGGSVFSKANAKAMLGSPRLGNTKEMGAITTECFPSPPLSTTVSNVMAIPLNAQALMASYPSNLTSASVSTYKEETQSMKDFNTKLGSPTSSTTSSLNLVYKQWHESVSVLFCDIVGYTSMSQDLEPEQVMVLLHELFTKYDKLAEKWGVYKVETIGDCYMACTGVTRADPKHAETLLSFAVDMVHAANSVINPLTGNNVSVRVGLHSGRVMSGIVGMQRARYCLFGDTVNTASRMESTGVANHLQISESTYRLLPTDTQALFACRGEVQVKGKGEMLTYLLDPSTLM